MYLNWKQQIPQGSLYNPGLCKTPFFVQIEACLFVQMLPLSTGPDKSKWASGTD